MPRFLTVSQIDRLGDRFRRSANPSEADLELLQRLRLDYDPPLAAVESLLRDRLSLQPTSRLKTIGTIIGKLKREKTRLSKMQDIAGVRIVRRMHTADQDHLVRSIESLFPGSQVIDRRARPSHGYRAVHIVPIVDDCPVEIQVRTGLQDSWAQLVEKLADSIGREIRYGELSTEGLIGELITEVMEVSKRIAETEELLPQAARAGVDTTGVNQALDGLLNRLRSIVERIK